MNIRSCVSMTVLKYKLHLIYSIGLYSTPLISYIPQVLAYSTPLISHNLTSSRTLTVGKWHTYRSCCALCDIVKVVTVYKET